MQKKYQIVLETIKTPEEVLEIISDNIDNSTEYTLLAKIASDYFHGKVKDNTFCIHKDTFWINRFPPEFKGVLKVENNKTKIYISIEEPTKVLMYIAAAVWVSFFMFSDMKYNTLLGFFLVAGLCFIYLPLKFSKEEALERLMKLIDAKKVKC